MLRRCLARGAVHAYPAFWRGGMVLSSAIGSFFRARADRGDGLQCIGEWDQYFHELSVRFWLLGLTGNGDSRCGMGKCHWFVERSDFSWDHLF